MTRIDPPADGYAVVDQLKSAIVDGNGVAKSFVQDRFNTLFRWVKQASTWQGYEPTWTNLTVGNGTVVARHVLIGTTCHFYVLLVFGSTTTIDASGVFVSVPVSMGISSYQANSFVGMLEDASSGTDYPCFGYRNTADVFQVTTLAAGATHTNYNSLTDSVPFTWTTSDRIIIGGTYEIAT